VVRGIVADCVNLQGLYFEGEPPAFLPEDLGVPFRFGLASSSNAPDPALRNATVFYLPQNKLWTTNVGELATAVWKPKIEMSSITRSGGSVFQFNVAWARGQTSVVEKANSLGTGNWISLATNAPASGTYSFTDPLSSNSVHGLYRVRVP